jgi:hypothetical protein
VQEFASAEQTARVAGYRGSTTLNLFDAVAIANGEELGDVEAAYAPVESIQNLKDKQHS